MFKNSPSFNRFFPVALIFLAGLVLNGCGSVNKSQVVDFKQKSKEEFSSRDKLPRIISASEVKNLSKNEYLSLGELKTGAKSGRMPGKFP